MHARDAQDQQRQQRPAESLSSRQWPTASLQLGAKQAQRRQRSAGPSGSASQAATLVEVMLDCASAMISPQSTGHSRLSSRWNAAGRDSAPSTSAPTGNEAP